MIDSHAHLTFPQYSDDLEEVIERARQCAVQEIITIGVGHNEKDIEAAIKLAEKYDHIYSTVGVHPHEAKSFDPSRLTELLVGYAKHPKVVAIGEVGLDYFYEHSPRARQQEVFRASIEAARASGLPLIVHSRGAFDDVYKILVKEGAGKIGGVMHCFSEGLDEARAVIDLGLHISFTGVVTFKKAEVLRGVVAHVPLGRMLVETDAPFLAPEPNRGKRNEPAYLAFIVEKIAEIRGLAPGDVGRITRSNTCRLFKIGPQDKVGKIAYQIRNSLYLNITNACTLKCTFCPKRTDYMVKGHFLNLAGREPSVDEIIGAIGDPSPYDEVVFCGFGEPLLRLDLVKDIAKWLKGKGVKVRIDTDGLANLIHGRDVTGELGGVVDSISVSLNAQDGVTYARYCPSKFGEAGYAAVLDFIRAAKVHIPEITATVVTLPGVDIDACRKIVEQDLGVNFRTRPLNEVG